MKFGTVHKTVAGAVAFILIGSIINDYGSFLLKRIRFTEVEIVISSPQEFSDSAAQTRTARNAEIAVPLTKDTPPNLCRRVAAN